MASYSSPPTYKPSTYAAAQNPDVYAEDYDWVINKLRARGFKTLQDRRAEAEEQRKQRLAAWEAEKQRRRAAQVAALAARADDRADGDPPTVRGLGNGARRD